MNPIQIYSLLHVLSGILLAALTFAACAAPRPEVRKRYLMSTGILSLIMLVGGFGLVARVYENTWEHWMFIKIACWLGLSALAGFAFRKPEKAGLLMVVATILIAVAVATVYTHGRNAM